LTALPARASPGARDATSTAAARVLMPPGALFRSPTGTPGCGYAWRTAGMVGVQERASLDQPLASACHDRRDFYRVRPALPDRELGLGLLFALPSADAKVGATLRHQSHQGDETN